MMALFLSVGRLIQCVLGVWADLQDFDCSIRNFNFIIAYDFLAVLGINRLVQLSLFYYLRSRYRCRNADELSRQLWMLT